jgi:hypothetical protein
MFIHQQRGYVEALAEDEQKAVFGEYMALAQDPRARGGEQLQPIETAKTVRVQGGQTQTTDGPYADTQEEFGGYYLFEVDNLDEAIELAARIPAARLGGAIEGRPLMERQPASQQESRSDDAQRALGVASADSDLAEKKRVRFSGSS